MIESASHSTAWSTSTKGLRHWHSCCLPGVLLLFFSFVRSSVGQGEVNLPHFENGTLKPYEETIANNVTFKMIPIPGGTFMMGSPASEKDRSADEGPQHPVTVKPFWMGECEVTWDEYDEYWLKIPGGPPPLDTTKKPDFLSDAITSPTPPYADETFGYGRKQFPVIGISHHAAMEYCRWLSKKTNKVYRLPTEAEWERACRTGTKTAYSFGDDRRKLDEYGWFEGNAKETSHKGRQKKPNAWGLYDMHGGVAEWCVDKYKADFYGSLPLSNSALNPFNPPTPDRYSYAVRGGSWLDKAERCRSASRDHSSKDWLKNCPKPETIWWLTTDHVGFRVVRAENEYNNLKGIRSKVTWRSE